MRNRSVFADMNLMDASPLWGPPSAIICDALTTTLSNSTFVSRPFVSENRIFVSEKVRTELFTMRSNILPPGIEPADVVTYDSAEMKQTAQEVFSSHL